MMSKLTVDSVYTKEQIYPVLLNFQNGIPREDFQVNSVLLQDGRGNSTVVVELDDLLYAGDTVKDLGQTFILARNRKTGKVRLIETRLVELKPVNKYTIQQSEAIFLESNSSKPLEISRQGEQFEQNEITIHEENREPIETMDFTHSKVQSKLMLNKYETVGAIDPLVIYKKDKEKVMTKTIASQMKNKKSERECVLNETESNLDSTFICNDCDRKFISKLLLITHIKGHNKNSSIIVKAKNNENKTKYARLQLPNQDNKENESKEMLKCTLCDYKSVFSGRFTRHMRVHNNKCEYCEREYRNIYDLKLHIRSHTGEKPFQCTMCDSKFASKINLNRHFKTHTQEKTYKCTLCTAEFKFAGSLTRHLNIHTKEKIYKCTTCGSDFNDGSSLKRHMGCHTDEKPYSCDHCKYKTTNSKELTKHMHTHKDRITYKFKCTSCDFSTKLQSTLKLHMTRHTGEKPYSCDRCKYATAHKSDLKRHAKKHTK